MNNKTMLMLGSDEMEQSTIDYHCAHLRTLSAMLVSSFPPRLYCLLIFIFIKLLYKHILKCNIEHREMRPTLSDSGFLDSYLADDEDVDDVARVNIVLCFIFF